MVTEVEVGLHILTKRSTEKYKKMQQKKFHLLSVTSAQKFAM